MKISVKKYRFYVLSFDGVFDKALITEDFFSSLSIAKVKCLTFFEDNSSSVPVIGCEGNFYYYNFKSKKWFKNLSELELTLLFHWLVC